MSEQTIERLHLADAQPLLVPARGIRLTRRAVQALYAGGHAGAVWLPCFAALSGRGSAASAVAQATVAAAVWLVALHFAYSAVRVTRLALGAAVGAAVGALGGLVVMSAVDAWVEGLSYGHWTLALTAVGVFLLSGSWEALVADAPALRRRVLVVGARSGGADLVAELNAVEECPFELVGIVDDEHEGGEIGGVPVHGTIDDLPTIVEAQQPDLVVLAVDENRPEAFGKLLDVAGAGFKVIGLAQFYEHAFGRVPVSTVSPAWFMSVLHLYRRPYTRFAKRAFDVVVASIGLALTAPLLPVLALLVKRTPGPVIFRQTRLGEGGRHFTIYKFRTMRQDAEAAGAIWASERDPRITTIGRIMRKTRLDELPQLWNVLKGDMSIVGPRPERPEFVELLQETVPFWSRRHLVKPGITGWAQVRRGYTADASGTAEKLAYDLWYLRHRSVVVDLAICVKTFTTLATGSGAR